MGRIPGRAGNALAAALLLAVATGAAGAPPGREDHGDLIVLRLAGSWEEIGRQQAALMGPELRAVYELQHTGYREGLAAAGAGGWLVDRLLPVWTALGPHYEESGFHEELAGIAAGLDLPATDLMRALLALSAGSTVFAATRSATADGAALIGRNVDWEDAGGRRRPVVAIVEPAGDALAFVAAGWPLVGLYTVGVNEDGFALSFNFFVSEPRVGTLLPQWPHRAALQRASTVAEGIRIFEETRLLGISTFMVMADAAGDLAMVECLPSGCAVFRPEGDWFAQSNHARTAAMIPHDRYRSPDSFLRRAGMEEAVRPHLGRLDPTLAAAILRSRGAGPWPNASHVANLYVLNAAVVRPASRTLWHSTTMQPHAPFGAYLPFTPRPPRDPDGGPAPLPADPWLAGPERAREAESIAAARAAVAALEDGRFPEAASAFAALAAADPPGLDPVRIAWGHALALWHAGDLEGAFAALAPLATGTDRTDVAAHGLVARARLADRLGRRDEALRSYRAAEALLAAHPEFAEFFAPLHGAVAAGLAAPAADAGPPPLDFWLQIPR